SVASAASPPSAAKNGVEKKWQCTSLIVAVIVRRAYDTFRSTRRRPSRRKGEPLAQGGPVDPCSSLDPSLRIGECASQLPSCCYPLLSFPHSPPLRILPRPP